MTLSGQASTVAALMAVDPVGLGGVALRARASLARDQWLQMLRQLLPPGLPFRRVPLHVDDSRLLGGLDLAATLRRGRPVAQTGLLAQSDGGVAVLASAERLGNATAARLAQVLDTGEAVMERNGLSLRHTARLGLVALDEGSTDDEQLSGKLLDRMAFHLHLADATDVDSLVAPPGVDAPAIVAARALLPQVLASEAVVQALCGAAMALGVVSLRAPLLAVRAARAAAALDGRLTVSTDDSSLAAGLVLAPRATRIPEAPAQEEDDTPEPPDTTPPPEPANNAASDSPAQNTPPPPEPTIEELDDQVLQAAQAAIPAGLLAALQFGQSQRAPSGASSGSGAQQNSKARGRPLGARRGDLGAGVRLHVVETLRAAAPWQAVRQRESAAALAIPATGARQPLPPRRIEVRREDFHVSRFKQRRETTTIFVVDASGSAALHRLAEAKGAVELLLADCYVRRDRVAMLAFRGKAAELVLPPTRSLVRAKRSLAGMPGGGGTPLAAGMDAARDLALACERRGETPIVVVLTDGRANIARDGSPGRERAGADALAAARTLRAAGLTTLLLDTSPHPHAAAQQIATEMGGAYLPLPHAGAATVSQAVRVATARPAR